MNFKAVKKFLRLFFELFPNHRLLKKCPKSYQNIKNIDNKEGLGKWAENLINELNNKEVKNIIPTNKTFKKENPVEKLKLGNKENKEIQKNLNEFLKKHQII